MIDGMSGKRNQTEAQRPGLGVASRDRRVGTAAVGSHAGWLSLSLHLRGVGGGAVQRGPSDHGYGLL